MKRLILTIGFLMSTFLISNVLIGQSYFNGAGLPVVIGDNTTTTTNGNILEVEAINNTGNREQIASFGVNGLMNTDVLEIRNSTDANGTFSPTINGFRSSTSGSALYMIASCNPANDAGTTPLMSWDSRTYTNYFNGANGPTGAGTVNTRDIFAWRNNQNILMLMDANGQLGINAANPTARLHTNGTLRHQNLPNSNTLAQVLVTDANGNVFERNVPNLGSPGIMNACTNIGFLPLTNDAAGNLACSQIFDNGNRVGINTTTPSGRFHVVENNANTNSNSTHFNFQATSGSGTNDAVLFNISTGRGDGNTSNLFRISNASGDAVTVRGNRNVGVNVANPTARLHTNGTLRHQNLLNSNTLTQVLVTDASGNVFERNVPGLGSSGISSTCSSTNFVPKTIGGSGDLACSQIQDNGTTVGLGGISGTYTSGGTTYNLKQYVNGHSHIDGNQWVTSDMRYKKDIVQIESAMTLINEINGYEYHLNQDMYEGKNFGNEKTYGVIAQEIEEVIPELVATDQEGFKSVNYNAIIPFLIEAMKEQQEEINELREILTETSARNKISDEKNVPNGFILKQNFPNPARTITSISYDLKDQFEKAEIIITDIEGSIVRNYELKDDKGIIEVELDQLGKVGMYAYSLVINGKIMTTKKMIFSN